MVKISTMPKETLVELLLYLAENESFPSVSKNLAGGVTVEEVRATLRELAMALAREVATERGGGVDELIKHVGLSPKAKKIIKALSTREGEKLLSSFDLIDK